MSDISPANDWEVIDVSENPYTCDPICRGVYVGTAGVINGVSAKGGAAKDTATLAVGYHPLKFRSITVDTTASDIMVYW